MVRQRVLSIFKLNNIGFSKIYVFYRLRYSKLLSMHSFGWILVFVCYEIGNVENFFGSSYNGIIARKKRIFLGEL